MGERRYWFEDVPEDHRFYFLVQWGPPQSVEGEFEVRDQPPSESVFEEADELARRAEEVGFAPEALSPPWWIEAQDRETRRQGDQEISVPGIFTTRERAEERLRYRNDPDVELKAYTDLVKLHGEELVDRAYSNTSPLRVLWMDRATLLTKLGEAEFPYLRVDDQLKPRGNFMMELRQLEEG